MSACFHPFDRHIVCGATYEGQVVLWDTRQSGHAAAASSSASATAATFSGGRPAQSTALSTQGHAHPVYSLAVTGTQNAHQLTTLSTDGKMCSWALEQLATPTHSLTLTQPGSAGSAATDAGVAATAMAFPARDGAASDFCVGSEDGAVLRARLHQSGGKGGGGGAEGVFAVHGAEDGGHGHTAPVTSMQFRPLSAAERMRGQAAHGAAADALLTSSMDWTAKLWNFKLSSQPLYSFDNASDYVFDTCWSPRHPALFCAADGDGHLDLWHINRDVEAPVVRTAVGDRALSKAVFSHDGRKIATGDSAGTTHVYSLSSELCTPRADEAELLGQRLEARAESMRQG